MEEALKLLSLYRLSLTTEQKEAVQVHFERLCIAYPEKRHHKGGYTDMWLTAIEDVISGESPWIR